MRSRALAHPARHAFLRSLQQPHPDIVETVLCIAWEDQNRDARTITYQHISDFVAVLAPRIQHVFTLIEKVDIINEYLFDEVGFFGNSQDYYAARNSFLDQVVHHKTGLPIMLSILYMAITRRLGLVCHGVAFPGHFMVQYRDGLGDPIVIDPFRSGKRWSMSECANFLTYHRVEIPVMEMLAPPSFQAIVVRVLRNLKGVYLSQNDFEHAAAVLERMLALDSQSAPDVRDYGLILGRLGMTNQALAYLERYLTLAPNAIDRDSIRHHAKALIGTRAELS